jgi:hypothetical protein
MKKIKIAYWVVTVIFAALMIFSSYADILGDPQAIGFVTGLGYPVYFVKFISWAKVFGVAAILIPGFPRIKEWAYAGLTFDLVGATFSIFAMGATLAQSWMMFVFIGMGLASYFLYHKVQKAVGKEAQ